MIEKVKAILDVIISIFKILLLAAVVCLIIALSVNIEKIMNGAEQIAEKINITVKNVKVEDVGVSDVKVEQVDVEDVHVGSHISLESDKRKEEEKAVKKRK